VLSEAINRGLLLLYAGKTVIRFLPPLVIEMDQLEKAAQILKDVLMEEEKKVLKTQQTA